MSEDTIDSRGGKSKMLLLHGFTGTPVMWDPLLPYLRRHHDVVAINMPGHYGGPDLPDPGDHIIDTVMDRVELQMDELGWDRAHIVGNSLGGWGALLLAKRHRALSTVAFAPAGGWELNSAESKRAVAIFLRMQMSLALFYPLALQLACRPRGRYITHWDSVGYPARLPGALAKQWVKAAKNCPARDKYLQFAPIVNYPSTMDDAEGPIRIAWGTKDRILPYKGYSPGWRKVLPEADWVTLNGLGHVPMSDDPELVASTVLEVSTAFDAAQTTAAA
ncbi:MAG: alpha/beta hydrolase [Solirubrobacterales bacterium]